MIKVARVKFNGSEKFYDFKTDLELSVGDLVVCDTAVGYSIGNVVTLAPLKEVDYKWIVCKIDLTAHRQRLEKEANLQLIKSKMEIRKKQIDDSTMFSIYADKDDEMKALFEEYKKIKGE